MNAIPRTESQRDTAELLAALAARRDVLSAKEDAECEAWLRDGNGDAIERRWKRMWDDAARVKAGRVDRRAVAITVSNGATNPATSPAAAGTGDADAAESIPLEFDADETAERVARLLRIGNGYGRWNPMLGRRECDPSPEEIERECEAIQPEWSQREQQRRIDGRNMRDLMAIAMAAAGLTGAAERGEVGELLAG